MSESKRTSSSDHTVRPLSDGLAALNEANDHGAYVCQRCGATYPNPIGDGGVCKNCEWAERAAAQRRWDGWRKSGVPTRFANLRGWSELDGPPAYRARLKTLREFIESGDSVLALIGDRGTGKTQAACVGISEAIAAGNSARYVTVFDLMADLKARYGDGGNADGDWLREWCQPALLVVDEIAERMDTAHSRVAFSALIDKRYGLRIPTVLIDNMTPDQFLACVGGSVADRCNDGGGIVQFSGWASFRGRVAKPRIADIPPTSEENPF